MSAIQVTEEYTPITKAMEFFAMRTAENLIVMLYLTKTIKLLTYQLSVSDTNANFCLKGTSEQNILNN